MADLAELYVGTELGRLHRGHAQGVGHRYLLVHSDCDDAKLHGAMTQVYQARCCSRKQEEGPRESHNVLWKTRLRLRARQVQNIPTLATLYTTNVWHSSQCSFLDCAQCAHKSHTRMQSAMPRGLASRSQTSVTPRSKASISRTLAALARALRHRCKVRSKPGTRALSASYFCFAGGFALHLSRSGYQAACRDAGVVLLCCLTPSFFALLCAWRMCHDASANEYTIVRHTPKHPCLLSAWQRARGQRRMR
jgi:hypothetical protein